MADTFMVGRTATVLQQFREIGFYPGIDPPILRPHSGMFKGSIKLDIAATSGDTYNSTDGTDPREISSEVSAQALKFGVSAYLISQTTMRVNPDRW